MHVLKFYIIVLIYEFWFDLIIKLLICLEWKDVYFVIHYHKNNYSFTKMINYNLPTKLINKIVESIHSQHCFTSLWLKYFLFIKASAITQLSI